MVAPSDDPSVSEEFLLPVVTGWLGAIKKAEDSKKWFNRIYDQCEKFYSANTGFMWEPAFRKTFMAGGKAPKFKITLAKAFEFVSLLGPSLFWQNPTRELRPRKKIEIKPEQFWQYGPYAEQYFNAAVQQQQMEWADEDLRYQLVESYLNYSPGEQPGGGLAAQAKLAITECLISGRGCLWAESYTYPGSDRTLTGLFYDTNKNLMIDPDAKMADLSDARWIARRHVSPRWEVEKKFGYREGALRDKGSLESQDSQGRNKTTSDVDQRKRGNTYDLIEWYEVWSKCGVGYRLRDMEKGQNLDLDKIGDAIEKVVGDYAYLCVCQDVPHPLNAHRAEVAKMDAEEMIKAFEWPCPYWIDNKWPVRCLDFYTIPETAWPMAPMAPGLGELMFLNVMVSHLANRIHTSSRDFVAVLKSATEEVEAVLKDGEDLSIIHINDVTQKSIQEVIQVLQFPPVNIDAWKIIDMIAEMFDKRVGLTELLYGLNAGGVQSRSAQDAQNKDKYSSIRPDFLARCVDDWMEELADTEKFCARWYIKGKDITPLVGSYGAEQWDRLIVAEDPELVVRNMKARIVANSSRKPNRAKDAENLGLALQHFMPLFQGYAQQSGDYTQVNELLRVWGKANEMDVERIEFQTQPPQTNGPSPEEMQMQQEQMAHEQQQMQQQAQMESERHGMEMQKVQAELESKQIDMQTKMFDAQVKQQMAEQDLAFKQAEMQMDLQKSEQDMMVDTAKAGMDLQQAKEKHVLGMQQQREAAKTKNQIAKQQAKQKPQPQRGGGNGRR